MEILEKFNHLVKIHFKEEHDIAFYEKKLNLQPKYLSKLSKKLNVAPPCQVLIDQQISYSESLLLQTNKNVKEIAYELNFQDPYYFSRLFKKKKGISPSKYRQVKK